MTLVRSIAILCTGVLLCGQTSGINDLDAAFGRDRLVIQANEHACYVFDVYLALSREQRTRGLMYVRYMPDFTGMLFYYPEAQTISMWMKNTYIPLDILFIRGDGTVANIETNTEPLSLQSIAAIEPLNYALELNAGVTARLKIDTQSRVYFPEI